MLMGCGASVDMDSDSQESGDEWDRNRAQNRNRDDPDARRRQRTPRRREPDSRDHRGGGPGRRRRKSQESNASEYSSEEEEEDEESAYSSRRRNPRSDRERNGEPPNQRIAVVSDMVPYPVGAGARVDSEMGSADFVSEGGLFIDVAFPPSEASLYHNKRKRDPDIRWMRPHELSPTPELLIDGASRHDIVQGVLADCWFLSSCASVAQRPDLMEQVIPPNQPLSGEGYKGQVTFQFWRFGRWVAVFVDDLLPTKKKKLVYSRSSEPREFWVSLLEKAYAKLHGSYEALEGGQSMDALVDLTGGLAERYELESPPTHLYEYLLQASTNGAFITCSRKGDWKTPYHTDANGLVSGHAYTISAVATVELSTGSEACLIRIRNPWGTDAEWNGQWNDRDQAWRNVDSGIRQTIGYSPRGDGEFWMSFQDFCREFEEVTICSIEPDLMGTGFKADGVQKGPHLATHMRSIIGRWEPNKSAGGSRNNLALFATNPQFLLTVAEPGGRSPNRSEKRKRSHVVIALMQLRRRCVRHPGRKMMQIGFVLYKTEEPARLTLEDFVHQEETGNSGAYINYREVFTRFELQPGYYVIIPATFEPNSPGSFLIRVFSDSRVALSEL